MAANGETDAAADYDKLSENNFRDGGNAGIWPIMGGSSVLKKWW